MGTALGESHGLCLLFAFVTIESFMNVDCARAGRNGKTGHCLRECEMSSRRLVELQLFFRTIFFHFARGFVVFPDKL